MDERVNLNGFALKVQLQNEGLLDDFESRRLRCASCDTLLDVYSVGRVIPDNLGSKGFASCRDESCVKSVKNWASISLQNMPMH